VPRVETGEEGALEADAEGMVMRLLVWFVCGIVGLYLMGLE